MTKCKTFSMRCDQHFLDTLNHLSEQMGVSRAQFVEITVGIYPGLVKLMLELEETKKMVVNSL